MGMQLDNISSGIILRHIRAVLSLGFKRNFIIENSIFQRLIIKSNLLKSNVQWIFLKQNQKLIILSFFLFIPIGHLYFVDI